MQTKRTTGQGAHYVCGGCGRLFQTVLKLYGHEKICKGRKAEVPIPGPVMASSPVEVVATK